MENWVEKYFLELIDGFEWKYNFNKFPTSLFVFKNNICLFEIEGIFENNQKKIIASNRLKTEYKFNYNNVWINYDKLWSIIESEFKMNYTEMEFFLIYMFEKNFNFIKLIPYTDTRSIVHDFEKQF